MVANPLPERRTMAVEACARRRGSGRTTCYAAVRVGITPSIKILEGRLGARSSTGCSPVVACRPAAPQLHLGAG